MALHYTYQQLSEISKEYGDAFYILDTAQFRKNFEELKAAFASIYPHSNIAYSYKTNYIPRLVQMVHELGGYAEVVSDMELDIARHCGVPAAKIIFNGPYKKPQAVEELLLSGGTVNIDSVYELENIGRIAQENPMAALRLGIRVNFDINDGVLSRFGIDVDSDDLPKALQLIRRHPNIRLVGLHCHYATRDLETWPPRAKGMLRLIDKLGLSPEHIDLGGGLFGKMPDELKRQFDSYIPTYSEYASAVATVFAEHYQNTPVERRPLLLIEPGSAIVGDCMSLAATVQSIKLVRQNPIATVLASSYNINMGTKNPSIQVIEAPEQASRGQYEGLRFAGFTCIEADYLYTQYNGSLAVGDYVVFLNVGSYSIVFKPPFILPNFAVVAISDGKIDLIKRAETYNDLFQTYVF